MYTKYVYLVQFINKIIVFTLILNCNFVFPNFGLFLAIINGLIEINRIKQNAFKHILLYVFEFYKSKGETIIMLRVNSKR